MNLKLFLARKLRESLTLISPVWNTKVAYRVKFHKKLDLKKPITLNEKILWLKFNDYLNNPIIKQCADKYMVREYIKNIGCGEILNHLITDFSSPDDFNIDILPPKFVLKLNAGCGYNHIVFDKTTEDPENIKDIMQNWIKA